MPPADTKASNTENTGAGPHLLSQQSRQATSSAIRDLLVHARRPGIISLAGGLPSAELFPTAPLIAAASTILSQPQNLQYGLTEGEFRLREIVAEIHTTQDRLATTPDNVQIVSGSQQALDLIARVTLDPGDEVVVSDPEYLGAIGAFRGVGGRLVPIPIDSHGLDVDALDEQLRRGLRPKLCYLVPEFHNPTGQSTTVARLTRLATLADRYGFLIIEDNPYGALRFDGEPVRTIASMTENVVQCRTISKTIAPGLRVAWMIGPGWLLDAVRVAKQSVDLHTPTITQHLAGALLGDAEAHRIHMSRLASHYMERRDSLMGALDEHMPAAQFVSPAGGMFLWLTMPESVDTGRLLPFALERGVAFVPGSAFAVRGNAHHSMRLSYSTATPSELRTAVGRLAAALTDWVDGPDISSPR